ncbi:MAG: ABC transporter permease [Turicibacter sp.]|nr:ABC transporter permease [Turicibacter sp.]
MLSKNILRTIRQKPFQFLSLVALVTMASFIYVALQGSIASVSYFLTDYAKHTNQEDFFVVLSSPTTEDIKEMMASRGISVTAMANQSKSQLMTEYEYDLVDYYNDRVALLEQQFDATFEGRFYRDVITKTEDQTITYRVIQQMDAVNLTYVLEGSLPTQSNEVAVFKTYADANHLNVGDSILLKDRTFVISAFVAVPDYIYPVFNYDSPLYEPARESIAIVTDDAYEAFDEKQWVLYSGSFNHEVEDLEAVVSQISDAYGVSYAMSKEMNVRISTVHAHITSNQLLAMTFTGLLLVMSMTVILLVMRKRIQSERGQIGVLKAMGYSQTQIAISYVTYPLLSTVIGSLMGFFLGIGASTILARTYMTNYIVPVIRFYFTKDLILGGVLCPIMIIGIASFFIIYLLLKDDSLSLMRESSHLKISRLSKGLMNLLKPFNFETRFKYSLAFRNIGKIFSLFSVVLVASVFLVFASIAVKSIENIVDKAFKGVSYNYQIKYSKLVSEILSETETPFLQYTAYPSLEGDSTPFYIYGIDPANTISPFYNAVGEEITSLAEEGLLINEFIARAYSLGIGDELTVQIKGKTLTYPIVGIVDHYNGPMIYTSLEGLAKQLNLEAGFYNGKWSSERPDSDKNISYILSIDDLVRNIEVGMEMIRISLMIMVGVAMILGSIMMVLITTFIIDENQKQISILKVMGYSEREISRMVLTIYFPFVMIAYLLSIPLTKSGVDYLMTRIAAELPMAIPTDFTIIQMIVGGFTVVMTYFIAMKCSKVQLDRISLHEVLKY